MIKTRAGEKAAIGAGPGDVVPNGVPNDGAFGYLSCSFPSNALQKLISCSSDDARALNEIQHAFTNILSNLGKLVPVERQHVTPPAIAA